jgi:lysophospholipase L1-like esterase
MPREAVAASISPAKKALAGIVATFVLGALILALAEGAVRVRAWIKYGSAERLESMYHFDSELGLKYPSPNYRTRTIRINSSGFRGPELADSNEPSRVRIAFLGGSTTFCAEVSGNDHVWAHLVSERLQQAFPEIKFDYVNGGVPGYTLTQSLKNLRHRIAPLKPDAIVIYHASNDMSGETRELAKEKGLYYEYHREKSWLAERSLLWYLAKMNLEIMQVKEQVVTDTGRLKSLPDEFADGFRQELENLIDEARKVASLVVIATWSHQIRKEQTIEQKLEAAASALYYMPFMTPDSLVEGYERYNEAIRQAAGKTGALLVEDENSIPGDSIHFNDSVHFKDPGSVAMANRVSEAILNSDAFRKLIEDRRNL